MVALQCQTEVGLRSSNLGFVGLPGHEDDEEQAPSIAVERYRDLVRQLRDETGGEHGWQARVSERLGVSHPYPKLILEGKKRAGIDAIELAIGRLRLDPDFFFDRLLESPDYTAYVIEPTAPTPEPPFWAEFLEHYPYVDQLDASDFARIRAFAFRGQRYHVRSWTDWERLAELLRTSPPSPTFERKRKR